MIVIYKTSTGEIYSITYCGQTLEATLLGNTPDGCHAVETGQEDVDFSTHYILNGEVTERPASPVTRTDLTLLDVPTGSKLYINGESYDAAGTVELEFPLPGTYRLRVECFPFLDWTDEVVV